MDRLYPRLSASVDGDRGARRERELRAVRRAAQASRFETVFKRRLGEVDEKSHGRQGLPGDWRNHFSRRVRRAFHERTGDLIEAAGYEKDSRWIDEP